MSRFDEAKPFKAWLFSILRNQCFDMLRRRKTGKQRPLGENEDFKEYDQMRPGAGVKAARGVAWTLFAGGAIFVALYGAYAFLTDPGVAALEKTLVAALWTGLGLLFFSVLYERIIAAKSDPYTEVEK